MSTVALIKGYDFLFCQMTAEEEAEIDEMFSDQIRDDLKLELILKALTILKV